VLTGLTAAELARRLSQREVSVREVADAYLDRIEKLDSQVGAFLTVSRDTTRQWADQAQQLLDRGEGGPLTGVPIAVKDNISTKGVRTTCASKVLENYVPPFDATVVRNLKAAGLVMLGKTNLDEFAMGTSTENSAFQVTHNPWDLERTPGGSSGGSAAAVAGHLAPLSIGSDTGGSIRAPAALCGIAGFKPSYGRCSRYGLVAFGSSLDQIGPFATTVEDIALLSEVLTGHDPLDSTSLKMPAISSKNLQAGSLKGLKVAIPKELLGNALNPEVSAAFHNAVDELKRQGAVLTEISLPSVKLGVTTYYIIAPAEASSNLARFDGIRYGQRIEAEGDGHIAMVEKTRAQLFGHEVKARIMIGTYALSAGYYDAYYNRAQQVRALMQREFAETFKDYDVVISPTSPVTAFKLGELKDDPLALKLLDLCTIPANMGGMPAISLNCGFANGLPVGLQIMAAPLEDEKLLQIAYSIEQALPEAVVPAPFG
jgi:aspartyl-tRNA(Asn)/glutamyl-tRNA(Gln) amidotransferase subunit A